MFDDPAWIFIFVDIYIYIYIRCFIRLIGIKILNCVSY